MELYFYDLRLLKMGSLKAMGEFLEFEVMTLAPAVLIGDWSMLNIVGRP